MGRHQQFLKFVAIVVILCLLAQDVAAAWPQPTNNQRPTTSAKAKTSGVADGSSGVSGLPRGDDGFLKIPSNLGMIDEEFEGTNGKHITFILDAHDSLDAQKNIVRLIQKATASGQVQTVFEEGYEGELNTDEWFGGIQDKTIRKKVSYYYLDQLKIGAAEFAHINRSEIRNQKSETRGKREGAQSAQGWRLIGADDKQAYLENVRAFGDSEKVREQILRDTQAIQRELKALSEKQFSPEAKQWVIDYERFHDNSLPLLDYLTRRVKLLPADVCPLLRRILAAAQDPEIARSIQKTRATEVLNELSLFEAELEKKLFLESHVPVIAREQSDRGNLETQIASSSTRNDSAVKPIQIWQAWKTMTAVEKLAGLQISNQELGALKANLKTWKTETIAPFLARAKKNPVVISKRWETLIQQSLKFYELAHKRDEAVERALLAWSKQARATNHEPRTTNKKTQGERTGSVLRQGGQASEARGLTPMVSNNELQTEDRESKETENEEKEENDKTWPVARGSRPDQNSNAVLVFGGFHREGMTEILRRNGFSYTVIIPKIAGLSPRHQEVYRQLMSAGAPRTTSHGPRNAIQAARPISIFLNPLEDPGSKATDPGSGAVLREIDDLVILAKKHPTLRPKAFAVVAGRKFSRNPSTAARGFVGQKPRPASTNTRRLLIKKKLPELRDASPGVGVISQRSEARKDPEIEVLKGGQFSEGSTEEEMLWVLDSQTGERTNVQKMKKQMHQDGEWHETAHVHVFDKEGRILVAVRGLEQVISAGKIQVAAGGHTDAKDPTPRLTALREGKEELGITLLPERLIQVTKDREYKKSTILTDGANNEFYTVFAYTMTDKEKEGIRKNYNLHEAEEYWLLTPEKLKQLYQENPSRFSNSFHALFRETPELYERLLAAYRRAESRAIQETTRSAKGRHWKRLRNYSSHKKASEPFRVYLNVDSENISNAAETARQILSEKSAPDLTIKYLLPKSKGIEDLQQTKIVFYVDKPESVAWLVARLTEKLKASQANFVLSETLTGTASVQNDKRISVAAGNRAQMQSKETNIMAQLNKLRDALSKEGIYLDLVDRGENRSEAREAVFSLWPVEAPDETISVSLGNIKNKNTETEFPRIKLVISKSQGVTYKNEFSVQVYDEDKQIQLGSFAIFRYPNEPRYILGQFYPLRRAPVPSDYLGKGLSETIFDWLAEEMIKDGAILEGRFSDSPFVLRNMEKYFKTSVYLADGKVTWLNERGIFSQNEGLEDLNVEQKQNLFSYGQLVSSWLFYDRNINEKIYFSKNLQEMLFSLSLTFIGTENNFGKFAVETSPPQEDFPKEVYLDSEGRIYTSPEHGPSIGIISRLSSSFSSVRIPRNRSEGRLNSKPELIQITKIWSGYAAVFNSKIYRTNEFSAPFFDWLKLNPMLELGPGQGVSLADRLHQHGNTGAHSMDADLLVYSSPNYSYAPRYQQSFVDKWPFADGYLRAIYSQRALGGEVRRMYPAAWSAKEGELAEVAIAKELIRTLHPDGFAYLELGNESNPSLVRAFLQAGLLVQFLWKGEFVQSGSLQTDQEVSKSLQIIVSKKPIVNVINQIQDEIEAGSKSETYRSEIRRTNTDPGSKETDPGSVKAENHSEARSLGEAVREVIRNYSDVNPPQQQLLDSWNQFEEGWAVDQKKGLGGVIRNLRIIRAEYAQDTRSARFLWMFGTSLFTWIFFNGAPEIKSFFFHPAMLLFSGVIGVGFVLPIYFRLKKWPDFYQATGELVSFLEKNRIEIENEIKAQRSEMRKAQPVFDAKILERIGISRRLLEENSPKLVEKELEGGLQSRLYLVSEINDQMGEKDRGKIEDILKNGTESIYIKEAEQHGVRIDGTSQPKRTAIVRLEKPIYWKGKSYFYLKLKGVLLTPAEEVKSLNFDQAKQPRVFMKMRKGIPNWLERQPGPWGGMMYWRAMKAFLHRFFLDQAGIRVRPAAGYGFYLNKMFGDEQLGYDMTLVEEDEELRLRPFVSNEISKARSETDDAKLAQSKRELIEKITQYVKSVRAFNAKASHGMPTSSNAVVSKYDPVFLDDLDKVNLRSQVTREDRLGYLLEDFEVLAGEIAALVSSGGRQEVVDDDLFTRDFLNLIARTFFQEYFQTTKVEVLKKIGINKAWSTMARYLEEAREARNDSNQRIWDSDKEVVRLLKKEFQKEMSLSPRSEMRAIDFFDILKAEFGDREISLIDVGTGDGDFPLALKELADERKLKINMTASDLNSIWQARILTQDGIDVLEGRQGETEELVRQKRKFDVVIVNAPYPDAADLDIKKWDALLEENGILFVRYRRSDLFSFMIKQQIDKFRGFGREVIYENNLNILNLPVGSKQFSDLHSPIIVKKGVFQDPDLNEMAAHRSEAREELAQLTVIKEKILNHFDQAPESKGFTRKGLFAKSVALILGEMEPVYLSDFFNARAKARGNTLEEYADFLSQESVGEDERKKLRDSEMALFEKAFFELSTRLQRNYPVEDFPANEFKAQIKQRFSEQIKNTQNKSRPVVFRFGALGDGHEFKTIFAALKEALKEMLEDPTLQTSFSEKGIDNLASLSKAMNFDFRFYDLRPKKLDNIKSIMAETLVDNPWFQPAQQYQFAHFAVPQTYEFWEDEATAVVVARNLIKDDDYETQSAFSSNIARTLENGGLYLLSSSTAYDLLLPEYRLYGGFAPRDLRGNEKIAPPAEEMGFVPVVLSPKNSRGSDYHISILKKTITRSESRTSTQNVYLRLAAGVVAVGSIFYLKNASPEWTLPDAPSALIEIAATADSEERAISALVKYYKIIKAYRKRGLNDDIFWENVEAVANHPSLAVKNYLVELLAADLAYVSPEDLRKLNESGVDPESIARLFGAQRLISIEDHLFLFEDRTPEDLKHFLKAAKQMGLDGWRFAHAQLKLADKYASAVRDVPLTVLLTEMRRPDRGHEKFKTLFVNQLVERIRVSHVKHKRKLPVLWKEYRQMMAADVLNNELIETEEDVFSFLAKWSPNRSELRLAANEQQFVESVLSDVKKGNRERTETKIDLKRGGVDVDVSPKHYVIPDIHGDLRSLLEILVHGELIDDRGHWKAGQAVLVQLGDVFDHGPHGFLIYKYLSQLQEESESAGGQVIRLIGNHEWSFYYGLAGHDESLHIWIERQKSIMPEGMLSKIADTDDLLNPENLKKIREFFLNQNLKNSSLDDEQRQYVLQARQIHHQIAHDKRDKKIQAAYEQGGILMTHAALSYVSEANYYSSAEEWPAKKIAADLNQQFFELEKPEQASLALLDILGVEQPQDKDFRDSRLFQVKGHSYRANHKVGVAYKDDPEDRRATALFLDYGLSEFYFNYETKRYEITPVHSKKLFVFEEHFFSEITISKPGHKTLKRARDSKRSEARVLTRVFEYGNRPEQYVVAELKAEIDATVNKEGYRFRLYDVARGQGREFIFSRVIRFKSQGHLNAMDHLFDGVKYIVGSLGMDPKLKKYLNGWAQSNAKDGFQLDSNQTFILNSELVDKVRGLQAVDAHATQWESEKLNRSEMRKKANWNDNIGLWNPQQLIEQLRQFVSDPESVSFWRLKASSWFLPEDDVAPFQEQVLKESKDWPRAKIFQNPSFSPLTFLRLKRPDWEKWMLPSGDTERRAVYPLWEELKDLSTEIRKEDMYSNVASSIASTYSDIWGHGTANSLLREVKGDYRRWEFRAVAEHDLEDEWAMLNIMIEGEISVGEGSIFVGMDLAGNTADSWGPFWVLTRDNTRFYSLNPSSRENHWAYLVPNQAAIDFFEKGLELAVSRKMMTEEERQDVRSKLITYEEFNALGEKLWDVRDEKISFTEAVTQIGVVRSVRSETRTKTDSSPMTTKAGQEEIYQKIVSLALKRIQPQTAGQDLIEIESGLSAQEEDRLDAELKKLAIYFAEHSDLEKATVMFWLIKDDSVAASLAKEMRSLKDLGEQRESIVRSTHHEPRATNRSDPTPSVQRSAISGPRARILISRSELRNMPEENFLAFYKFFYQNQELELSVYGSDSKNPEEETRVGLLEAVPSAKTGRVSFFLGLDSAAAQSRETIEFSSVPGTKIVRGKKIAVADTRTIEGMASGFLAAMGLEYTEEKGFVQVKSGIEISRFFEFLSWQVFAASA